MVAVSLIIAPEVDSSSVAIVKTIEILKNTMIVAKSHKTDFTTESGTIKIGGIHTWLAQIPHWAQFANFRKFWGQTAIIQKFLCKSEQNFIKQRSPLRPERPKKLDLTLRWPKSESGVNLYTTRNL